MNIRLRHLWYHITASFWFLPSCMALGAVAASGAMIALDRVLNKGELLQQVGWIYSGGPDGSISVLSAIAGSTVTVAGVVFSITMVALTLASSQFGPRLLGNFMRDQVNQAVLGLFIGTFLYCLTVLPAIRRDPPFVPHLSITIGILLALACFFFVIYFIHHVAASINADNIIALVESDLERITDSLFPEEMEEETGRPHGGPTNLPRDFRRRAVAAPATDTGYVQAMDTTGLLSLATEEELIVRLEYRPGDFIIKGTPLARVWPPTADVEALTPRLNNQFILGRLRTPVQDIELCINQIVEIALRALSPGINDTFTAITCIDRLGAALSRLAGRRLPSPAHHDDDGNLRLISPSTTFQGAVDAAFNLIRQNANVPVMIRLLETLRAIASQAASAHQLQALLRQAKMIVWDARRRDIAPEDLRDILARYEALSRATDTSIKGRIRPRRHRPSV